MIYLAAPYSAATETEIEYRMEIFSRVMAKLISDGEVVVSPLLCHYIRKYGELPGNWSFWKSYSRTLLKSCTKLVIIDIIPDWQESVGVRGEIEFANEFGIPCYLYDLGTNNMSSINPVDIARIVMYNDK